MLAQESTQSPLNKIVADVAALQSQLPGNAQCMPDFWECFPTLGLLPKSFPGLRARFYSATWASEAVVEESAHASAHSTVQTKQLHLYSTHQHQVNKSLLLYS